MGYLTKYGTSWGSVPQTTGNVYFVAPATSYTVDGRAYPASDGNDGLSPERALATIAQAITNATADVSDVIALLPGTHTSASNVAVSKSGLTFVGVHPTSRFSPHIRPNPLASKVNWTSTFAGNAVTVTAADTTFIGINMIPLTARSFMGFSAAATRLSVVDCALTLSASASTSTKGFVASGAADLVSFVNLSVLNTIGAQGPCLDLTGCTHFLVDKPTVHVDTGSWAVAVQMGAGSQGLIRDGHWNCSGTAMTIGIDGTGVAVAKAVVIQGNQVGVSPGAGFVKNFTSTDAEVGFNYIATIGAGTGGTLVTVTA
jgi:hypothetical protein